MQPIFITGFESSGTTLLRRIISMHPALKKDLLHETKQLLTYKTANEAENNYFNEYASVKSGEKIPYLGNTDFIIQYINLWRDFWPDSLILHIIRQTDAVVASCKRRFNRHGNIIKNLHPESVNLVGEHIKDLGNFQNVPYEALIADPMTTTKFIYDRMGEVPEDDYIKKVISTKEPWMHGEKRCCGLRYKSGVK